MTDPTRRDVLKLTCLPVLAAVAPAPTPAEVFRLDPARPEPLLTWVTGLRGHTAIARSWPEGTTFAACRRCPAEFCSLSEGVCQVLVNAPVPPADAPAFELNAFLGGLR